MARRAAPLLSRPRFAGRVLGLWALGLGGIGASLALGTGGYPAVAGLGRADAFLNSAMSLSGTGPTAEMPTEAAKIFAGTYAVVAGLAWTALLGVVLCPFVHRMLRALHLGMQGGRVMAGGPVSPEFRREGPEAPGSAAP